MKVPVVVIVGRPNVGKSTFFNRVIGRRKAVVHDVSGVTRDANYDLCQWGGRDFYLVDTGGWVPGADSGMEKLVREQVELVLERAQVVVFLVDASVGVTDLDSQIADALRRGSKPVVVAVNKADTAEQESLAAEFFSLGLGEPLPLSSLHGRLVGEVLDRLVERLPPVSPAKETSDIRLAVVGKPNVGKSSLVNALVGEGRMIVHDEPGTTRDAVDTAFRYHGKTVTLVDTAGLRKRSRVHEQMEFFSALRTLRALDECDVAIVMFDATEPLTQQDLKVAALAHDSGKGVIVVYNKWDLVQKDTKTALRMEREFRYRAPFLSYAPVVFVSALTRQRVGTLPALALKVAENASKEIPTSELNRCLEEAVKVHSPPVGPGNKVPRILYGTQTGVAPPTFTLFVSEPRGIPASYERYLIRKLRERFGFEGSPVRLRLRKRA